MVMIINYIFLLTKDSVSQKALGSRLEKQILSSKCVTGGRVGFGATKCYKALWQAMKFHDISFLS